MKRTITILSIVTLLTFLAAVSLANEPPTLWTQHNNACTSSVAFSPDGSLLATASWDHSVKIWNANNGTLIHTLNGHTDFVTSVAFSPDGQYLASGGGYNDKTAKIWRVTDGSLVTTLTAHSQAVLSLAFSPDGQTLATGSYDQTIKLWHVPGFTLVADWPNAHGDGVTGLAFSPNGSLLASSSWDSSAKLWSVPDGTCMKIFWAWSFFEVECVAFSPDGNFIATGGADYQTHIWDVNSGDEYLHIPCPGTVFALAYSSDGGTLAIGSTNLEFYQVGNSQPLARYHESDWLSIHAFKWSADSRTFAYGCNSGELGVAHNPLMLNVVPKHVAPGVTPLGMNPSVGQR